MVLLALDDPRYHRLIRRAATLAMLDVLAVAAPALAQSVGTITGTVTDANTSRPVPGVNIRVVGSPQSAISRADGTYRLQLLPGNYQLQASLIGYAALTQPAAVTAAGTTTVDFALTQSAVALDALVAVGTRRIDRTVTESPVPVDVLP